MPVSRLRPIPLAPLSPTPLVSILISTYNYGAYLPDCLESALAQTYPKFEIIICDDGSADNSQAIIEDYVRRDSRIRSIRKQNGGQASGFNAAFLESTGELLFFLDSDDMYMPSKLARMIDAHQRTPDAGLGLHRVLRVNKDKHPRGVLPLHKDLPTGWHGDHLLKTGGVLLNLGPTSSLSLHRSAANKIFPIPESFRLNADQVLTRITPLITSVTACNEVLAQYRQHDCNGYIHANVSAESIRAELVTCRQLWDVQADFLFSMDPALRLELRPIEMNSYYIRLQYLYARLTKSSDQRLLHHRFIADLRASSSEHLRFWKYSIFLPRFLFLAFLDLLISPGLLKQLISQIRGFR